MAKERAPQDEARAPGMDEATICQFVALLNEKWGPVEGSKPKLTLIQGGKSRVPGGQIMVNEKAPQDEARTPGMDEVSKCLLRAMLVAEWPELAVKPQLTLIQDGKGVRPRAEGRQRIDKRNRVKDWLESLGIDLVGITTSEQALFAVFDRMYECRFPPSF